ncbi:MAG: DEAD/DEAH box helicase [Planctomycetaceae bacterium]|nr:DEAD/DEAH box helicase [Planctomycetaceae bacterium]
MNTFQELNLIAPLQRAIKEENYTTPTPIQAQTIPSILEGRDILGSAQTGTGKTAAFALPILDHLGRQNKRPTPHEPVVLVLVPTRELAIQVGDSFATYGRHLRVRHALVYGGVSQFKQVRDLQRGVHVLVATPGRLLDLMEQGHIDLSNLEIFTVDEADRMMDMGFLPDLKKIIREIPEDRQSLFFSATLPPKIVELAQNLLTDPVQVTINPEVRSVELIEQSLIYVEQAAKKDLLLKMLQSENVGQTVVFTKTKFCANRLEEQLQRAGVKAIAIHGNKSQNARQRALLAFRQEKSQVLVATDVAARGIDVDGITHVFNYELPHEPESYVHRIGRTGRAGLTGIAISFCSSAERAELRAIEQHLKQSIPVDAERSEFIPSPNQPIRSSGNGKRSRFSNSGSGGGAGGEFGKRPFPRKPRKSFKSRTGNPHATGEAKASLAHGEKPSGSHGKPPRRKPAAAKH